MHGNDFETDGLGARELTDNELMQIQGGGFLGDLWNSAKNAVIDIAHDVVTTFTKPVDTIRNLLTKLGWPGPIQVPGPIIYGVKR